MVISGCGDSGSTTPAFPNSSTSTPSTDPTPNDPNTPNTPSTPSTPDTPNEPTPNPTPDQPAEEEGRQISLQFGAQSAAELANLKITKARYLVAKDLDDGQEKLMEGSLNLNSETKEMTIKDVPEEANTITCFYYNEEGKVSAASHTRLKRNQAQTQSALGKVALGKLAKSETEEAETTIHSVKDATWELKSDKDKAVKDEYITYTLKLITADNTVIDNVIGLTDQSIEIPQINGKDCLVPDTTENVVGRYKLVDAGDNGVGVIVRIDTDGGVQYIVPKYEVFLAGNDYLWEFSYNSQDSTVATPSTVFLKLSTCRASYEVDEATSPRRDYIKFIKNFDFYPNAQKNYVFNFQDTPLEYVSANCMATALLAEDRIKEIIGSPTIGTIVSLKPYEENESYMQNCGSHYYRGKSSEVYNISHILSFAFAENSSGKKVYSGSSGELAARGVGSFILSALVSSGYPCMESSKGEKDFASFEEAFNDILALYMSSQDINACRLFGRKPVSR